MDQISILKTASGKGLWVSGQTSPHKDKLKEMGGKWNPSKKSWVFSLQKKQILLDYFDLTEDEIGLEEIAERIRFFPEILEKPKDVSPKPKLNGFGLFSQELKPGLIKKGIYTEQEIDHIISQSWRSISRRELDEWCRKAGDW